MKAIWNDQVIAEADKDELIYIEGRWYFPPERVRQDMLQPTNTPYVCHWKGKCQYFAVTNGTDTAKDNAWSYPSPMPGSIPIVGKNYANYIAFWRDVVTTE